MSGRREACVRGVHAAGNGRLCRGIGDLEGAVAAEGQPGMQCERVCVQICLGGRGGPAMIVALTLTSIPSCTSIQLYLTLSYLFSSFILYFQNKFLFCFPPTYTPTLSAHKVCGCSISKGYNTHFPKSIPIFPYSRTQPHVTAVVLGW